jgi:hypothetical protein
MVPVPESVVFDMVPVAGLKAVRHLAFLMQRLEHQKLNSYLLCASGKNDFSRYVRMHRNVKVLSVSNAKIFKIKYGISRVYHSHWVFSTPHFCRFLLLILLDWDNLNIIKITRNCLSRKLFWVEWVCTTTTLSFFLLFFMNFIHRTN